MTKTTITTKATENHEAVRVSVPVKKGGSRTITKSALDKELKASNRHQLSSAVEVLAENIEIKEG